MDNATITFLNGLAQLLGLLPQKEQATTPKQKGGAIVKSQRGALTASPRGAITPSPSGAMTPATGGGAMQPGGGYQGVQVSQAPPRALPPAGGSTAMSGGGSPAAMSGGGARGALAAGPSPQQGRLGPLSTIAQMAGQFATDQLIGKPLSELIYQGAAQVPGTAASMGLRDEQGGTGYGGGQLTRFAEPIGPEMSAQRAATTQGQADAAQEVMPKQPAAAATQAAIEAPPKVTKREQLGNSLNTMYMKARREAMAIQDPIERERALEAVAMMGMEFHKEYYGKPDEAKGRPSRK